MYDEARTSAGFREQAALADREYRSRPERDPGDAILARSCVYGYLYDRYFLESRELLLNELGWLRRGGKPKAPRHAQSEAAFDQARDALLDELIARFSADAE